MALSMCSTSVWMPLPTDGIKFIYNIRSRLYGLTATGTSFSSALVVIFHETQGFSLFPGTQDDDREAASSEAAVYFGQCGWDGYSWGGRSRIYFRFSDSGR